MTGGRFEVDDVGFKTQMSEVPLWRLVQEIISNSFDEKSVSNITCTIKNVNAENIIQVTIIDDGDGFLDVKDIFTLYKDSYKRTNTNQAGRYNEGEKRFLAVAHSGYVETKEIHMEFNRNERTESKIEPRKGTKVVGLFEFNQSINELENQLYKIAVPEKKKLSINNFIIKPKTVVKSFNSNLYTVIAGGKNQKLVQIKKQTKVLLYKKGIDEKPMIYELGIPIQELEEDLKWHVDIRQKVPQTTDRNVVSDKYLQTLYAEITENTINLISDEESGSNWINDALKKTTPEISKQILKKRYGTEKVMIESTDHRENERALEDGAVLIKGSQLDSDVRNNLKSTDVLKFASKEYSSSAFENAKHVEPNNDMWFFSEVCKAVAIDTINKEITVDFCTTKETTEIAQYGRSSLSWNVRNCGGKSFFKEFSERPIGILIHELSHDKVGNNNGHAHLSHEFYYEMERIAGIIGKKGIQFWVNKVNNK